MAWRRAWRPWHRACRSVTGQPRRRKVPSPTQATRLNRVCTRPAHSSCAVGVSGGPRRSETRGTPRHDGTGPEKTPGQRGRTAVVARRSGGTINFRQVCLPRLGALNCHNISCQGLPLGARLSKYSFEFGALRLRGAAARGRCYV